jgi:hypothetical protein
MSLNYVCKMIRCKGYEIGMPFVYKDEIDVQSFFTRMANIFFGSYY